MQATSGGWELFDDGTRRRIYGTYGQYTHHQKSKLKRRLIMRGDFPVKTFTQNLKFREALKQRLQSHPYVNLKQKVLCLGARSGDEVIVFLELGHEAIGVDLYPGPNNKYVIKGDFHNLSFGDNSMDILYTNSLDHIHDIDKFLIEVKRVMKPDGLFIAECGKETEPGTWESFWWDSIESIVVAIAARGFKRVYKKKITCPWKGSHLGFKIK